MVEEVVGLAALIARLKKNLCCCCGDQDEDGEYEVDGRGRENRMQVFVACCQGTTVVRSAEGQREVYTTASHHPPTEEATTTRI